MKRSLVFIVTILSFSAIRGSVLPHGPLLIQVGKDAVFRWNTTGNSILAVRWGLKSGNDINPLFVYVSIVATPAPSVARASFIGNLTRGHAWFRLSNVVINDTGYYAANIRETGQSESKQLYPVNLTVTETPKFTAKPNALTIIREHKNLFINCSAIGPPAPDVTWMNVSNNMVTVIQGKGTAVLKIPNINRHYNRQKYKCQAENNPNEGPSETSTVIQVNYAPKFDENFTKQHYCIGDKAALNCTADGSPMPDITWIDHGQPEKGKSELKIDSIKDKHFENYTCVARNKVGNDLYVIQLVKTNVTCQPPVTTPTPQPTSGVHPGIIAGVVIAALLAIAGLVIAIIFWRRRKLYMNGNENQNDRSVNMNALNDNDDLYATAQHGNRDAPSSAEPSTQYAMVDKSKKTKKKIPGQGELIYADLDHDAPQGERPPSDRRPTGESNEQPTLYADIRGTRQETPQYGNLQEMDHM